MSVRIKRYSTNAGIAGDDNATEWVEDSPITAREVIDSEGYIYHLGVNEVKNFLDDGRGIAAGAFAPSPGETNIAQDAIPFGGAAS